MHFPGLSRGKEVDKLPTTEPKVSHNTIPEDMRKDSTISPSSSKFTKPPPTRTTSIIEPTYKTGVSRGPSNSTARTRPPLPQRRTTAKTRWIDMHLEQDNISKLHNILASFFTWVLLAGYIVFPATFNNFQNNKDLDDYANNQLKEKALQAARNLPLLYIAAFACGIGVLGSIYLWWRHWRNYLWVNNRIFLPALMNSIAGLISTIVNVYTAQDGQYSVTAQVTIVVTAACSVITLLLLLIFNFILLARIKRKHERETRELEKSLTGGEEYEPGADLKTKRQKAGSKKGKNSRDVGRIV